MEEGQEIDDQAAGNTGGTHVELQLHLAKKTALSVQHNNVERARLFALFCPHCSELDPDVSCTPTSPLIAPCL